MRTTRVLTLVAALVGISSSAGLCYPVSAPRLGSGVADSTVVAVGRIEAVGEGEPVARAEFGRGGFQRPQPVLAHAASLRPELLLKGPEPATGGIVAFQFLTADPKRVMISFQEYHRGERWLMFLKERQGRLEPLDQLGRQDSRLPEDLVLPEHLAGTPLEKAERLWASFLAQPDADFVLRCLTYLMRGTKFEGLGDGHAMGERIRSGYRCSFTTPELRAALRRLFDHSDPRVRLGAAAVLCSTNYAPALPVLIEATKVAGDSLPWIYAAGAVSGITDPAALPQLHALLSHPSAAFRQNAAYALRQIADPRSIPYLVRALDDAGFEVRYYAATGLASVTGKTDLYPSTDAFKKRERPIIQFWKRWYAESTRHPPS